MRFTHKTDTKLMQLLRINTISHPIARTSHGDLSLQLRLGEQEYQLILDAVPLSSDIHDEVMELIYPTNTSVPQVQKEPTHLMHNLGVEGKTEIVPIKNMDKVIKKNKKPIKSKK